MLVHSPHPTIDAPNLQFTRHRVLGYGCCFRRQIWTKRSLLLGDHLIVSRNSFSWSHWLGQHCRYPGCNGSDRLVLKLGVVRFRDLVLVVEAEIALTFTSHKVGRGIRPGLRVDKKEQETIAYLYRRTTFRL